MTLRSRDFVSEVLMAGRKSSAGCALGVFVLIWLWASGAGASIEIVAGTPAVFTAHCESFSGETLVRDYGVLRMSGVAQSGAQPVLQTFTFQDDQSVARINCHFGYAADSGAPEYQDFDVYATGPFCPIGTSCTWEVDVDGFYLQDGGAGGLQHLFQWIPGMGPSPSTDLAMNVP